MGEGGEDVKGPRAEEMAQWVVCLTLKQTPFWILRAHTKPDIVVGIFNLGVLLMRWNVGTGGL